MGKKAVLVYVSLMTRVIVDDTASEQDIMELAVPKLSENLMDSPFESIEDIKDDIECPYSVDDEGIDEWTTSDLFHYLLIMNLSLRMPNLKIGNMTERI